MNHREARREIDLIRVAIISGGSDFDLGSSIKYGFEQLGAKCLRIEEPIARRILPSRLALEAVAHAPWLIAGRNHLVSQVRDFQPELTLVIKGSFVDSSTVDKLKSIAPVVCWNPDSPFDFTPSNHGGAIVESIPRYSAYVTWSRSLAKSIRDLNNNTYVIPFGVDPRWQFKENERIEMNEEILLFGTPTQERLKLVRGIADLQPAIFGNGWERFRVKSSGVLVGRELAARVARARLCLNPLRPQNRDSHNMKSFEIPACGGRQLTMRTDDHEKYLGNEAVHLVEDIDSMIDVVRGFDGGTTKKIDMTGHTYMHRCAALLSQLRSDHLI